MKPVWQDMMDNEAKCQTCDGHGYLVDRNDNEGECWNCAGMGIEEGGAYPPEPPTFMEIIRELFWGKK